MFPFVSFLRTLPLHLLHLEPTNGRVNVWKLVCISRELQRQCNLASQPNKTCCDEPSSYFPLTLSLSCSLSTLSLLLRLLLLKQTNRRISTDDVLLQAASFNGRRMAFARDPSLSTVHTSNHEILLVDVHATNKQLQTVQHACMRASLFSLANSANVRMCFIETEIWNGRKGGNAPNNTPDTFNGDASHSKHTMKASNPPRRLCFHHAHLYTKYPTGLKSRQPITMHQPTMYRSGPAAAGNPSRRTS